MQQSPQNDLLDALSALHIGGEYSDLTIECNGRSWAVHRAVVCSRSSFFDGACSYDFREARHRLIRLDDDDPEAVEQMIKFFYRLDYSQNDVNQPAAVFRHRRSSANARRKLDLTEVRDPLLAAAGCYRTPSSTPEPENKQSYELSTTLRTPTSPQQERSGASGGATGSNDGDSRALLHARVYALAEKYDVAALKVLARRKFETAVACDYDSAELPEAIEEVYNSTIVSDRGLRNIVLRVFKAHPRLASTGDIYHLIQNTPALAQDLYRLEQGHAIGV